MSKIAVFLFISFAVFQISSGVSLANHVKSDLETEIGKIGRVMKELEKLETYVIKRIKPLPTEFIYEINEIAEKKGSYYIIEKLRKNITNIESGITNDESKKCVDNAWKSVVVITEELKKQTAECLTQVYETQAKLIISVNSLHEKIIALKNQISSGVHECINDDTTTDEQKVACLKTVADSAQKQLQILSNEVKKIHKDARKLYNDGIRNFKICLQKLKKTIQQMSDDILSKLNTCIQNANSEQPETFQKRVARGILDFFKELKEKIDHIIHIATHLPSIIQEIPDKINEIISHINISVIYTQLKSEVNEIIKDGGQNAEKCRAGANDKLNKLLSDAEESMKVCIETTEEKVEAIQNKIAAQIDTAKALLDEVNSQVWNCIWENKLNPIGFAKCLENNYDRLKQKLTDLQKETSEAIEWGKEYAHQLLRELASCANQVQLDTVKKGQVIIKETQQCVTLA